MNLLITIGVEDQLMHLEREEQELYNRRRTIGQIADQKAKFAKEMPYYPDAPKELISASELIQQQQEILARNGENQKKRERLSQLQFESADLQKQIDVLLKQQAVIHNDLEIAKKSAEDLYDESTEELEQNIRDIEMINQKVRTNLDKDKAEEDAVNYQEQYKILTSQLDNTRNKKIDLLQNAGLPLPGLSVEDGELTYQGQKWDNMSGSDQLQVATAIVRKLNPKCGFVLLDKLEQMDIDTLNDFGIWLEQEGLQAIATRVSTGGECSIIIEDGYVKDENTEETLETKSWKAGTF